MLEPVPLLVEPDIVEPVPLCMLPPEVLPPEVLPPAEPLAEPPVLCAIAGAAANASIASEVLTIFICISPAASCDVQDRSA